MADRFTQRTRRVMGLANDIALRHGLGEVTEVALLVAMIEEGQGIAATILRAFGVEAGPLYRLLPGTRGDLGVGDLMEPLRLSAGCRGVLEEAERVAGEDGAGQVGTEHLLVGMVRSGGTEGGKFLAEAGVTEGRIRETALRFA